MTHPRPLTEQQQSLIDLYSNCQIGMTPSQFYSKWQVSYDQIAAVCSRSKSTVQRWFSRGRNYRSPDLSDLRHLALMDFLLEHFEDIPSELFDALCSPPRGQ